MSPSDLLNSKVKLAYFAVLLLVLIMILYFSKSTEGLENQIYTAGASMRMVGQEFTSTNQENMSNKKKKKLW